jgi:hypothetical protein
MREGVVGDRDGDHDHRDAERERLATGGACCQRRRHANDATPPSPGCHPQQDLTRVRRAPHSGRGVTPDVRARAAHEDRSMRTHPGRRELAVFAAGYLTYFGVRAVTEGRVDRALANAASVIHLERVLGIAWEGAVQSTVAGSRVLEDLANAIYIYGHWPVLIVAGVLLYRYRREHYYTLRNACLLTGFLGLFVFALFPVAPPRLTDLPLIDTVTQGASGYRQILPPALVNQYAAMPSFHAGWNLAVGIVVFRATRNWALRVFAIVMPAAMAFAVVATANHYVIDVVVGVTLVLLALGLQEASVVSRRLHVGMPGGGEAGRPALLVHGHDRHRAPAGGRGARAPRRLLARRELPVRGADLPARQPAAARAAHARAHQATAARALGHDAGPELHLRPSESRHRS